MDALIMAGGVGRRMEASVLKPLILFKDRPLVKWVHDAAMYCPKIDRILFAITRDADEIRGIVDGEFILTPGKNYVDDMVLAIKQLSLKKTLILSADQPLLTSGDLTWVLDEYEKCGTPAMAVFVPLKLCLDLGMKPTLTMDGLVPTGVNVVDGSDLNGEETRLITTRPHFALNINTPVEFEKALRFAEDESGD